VFTPNFRLHESMNGVELLQQLFTHLNHRIPVIIVSGDNSIELKKTLSNTEHQLLIKPVFPAELYEAIRLSLE